MLQRIQTVYLLVVSICMFLCGALPLLSFIFNGDAITFEATGIYINGRVSHITWGLLSISCLSAILALVTLFFYKKRKTQVRMTIVNIVLIVCFYLSLGSRLYIFLSGQMPQFIRPGIGLAMPLISIVFCVMAIRSIKADEALVRSLDRLR
ncbi:MAG: DUF4293 domain-containing protein [Dysgonamonadaceae bacterium]|jgi:hypothetical protein|nr:DUF4293 domain-containing protein [Dysgonamonadaceae bacterium]